MKFFGKSNLALNRLESVGDDALLLLVGVVEDALLVLLATGAVLDELGEEGDITAVHSLAVHWVAADVLRRVHGDVDADLVDQSGGADGETGLTGQFVDFVWIDALLEHSEDFFQGWGQAAVAVEAGDVLGDDDQLLLLQPDGNGALQSLVRGLVSDDDLEELHLGNGGEVVHTNNISRVRVSLSDFTHQKTRSISSEDMIRLGNRLNFFNNLKDKD